jgi:hypothetical protein
VSLKFSRSQILFILVALILAFIMVRELVKMPAYSDAYYHFNVANRLAQGEGFVDDFLWTYIGAPDNLPASSNLYWMPMTSIIASAGMSLFDAPSDYASAQIFFILLTAGTGLVAYRLALMLEGTLRHAWIAGLMTILGGFFAARWGTMDTFAPYALIGSFALLFIGLGMSAKRRNGLYWILAGIFAGLGHLTRADGLILLLTAWAVLLFPLDYLRGNIKGLIRRRLVWLVLVTVFYIVTMTPWFLRNLNEIGTILPVGGTQSIWFTEYNDLFSYPPDASPEMLFADGLDTFIQSRWTAFTSNLGTFVAIEGMVIIAPLMLIGLWKRRHNLLLRGMWIFAIGIHVAMTFVFPYPGYRGGLLHAVAALVPFWMVLGMLGLDDVIEWIAKRRRTWNAPTAKIIFSIMLLFFGIIFTYVIASKAKVGEGGLGRVYTGIQELLPSDARVMINDPAQLYYWLGMGGVTLPNESVDIVPTIAKQYDIDYLFLEEIKDGFIKAAPLNFQFDPDNPPEFLDPIPFPRKKDVRLYAIITD